MTLNRDTYSNGTYCWNPWHFVQASSSDSLYINFHFYIVKWTHQMYFSPNRVPSTLTPH